MDFDRAFFAFCRKHFLIILVGCLIALWFPFAFDWSDYHGFISSLENPAELYDHTNFRPFFLLPWTIPLLYPFTLVTYQIGWIVFNLVSLFFILKIIHAYDSEADSLTIAVSLMSMFYMLTARLGQWEGVLLAAIFICLLGYRKKNPWILSIGLLLLSTKPINVWLVGLVLLWWTLQWDWREQAKIYVLPLLAFAGSIIWRPDWILEYIDFIRFSPPQTIIALNFINGFDIEMIALRVPIPIIILSIIFFGAFVWLHKPNLTTTIALAICVNIIASTYIQLYHFVLFIPVIILIAKESKSMRYLVSLYVISIFLQIFIFKGALLSYAPVVLLLMLALPRWDRSKTKMLIPSSS